MLYKLIKDTLNYLGSGIKLYDKEWFKQNNNLIFNFELSYITKENSWLNLDFKDINNFINLKVEMYKRSHIYKIEVSQGYILNTDQISENYFSKVVSFVPDIKSDSQEYPDYITKKDK